MKMWNYVYIDRNEIMMMSGWKLYIYGTSMRDVEKIVPLIVPISETYGLTTKVATENVIERNKDRRIAWATCVLYLTPSAIGSLNKLICDVNTSIERYDKKGNIYGAKSINSKLHYRYDLCVPVNPYVGIEYDVYSLLYRGEYGGYNIQNNLNPFYDKV